MKVTKKDIVQYIIDNSTEFDGDYGVDPNDIKYGVDTLMDIIEDFVADDHTIEIRHFGTFIPRKRKARLARVPKKGGREIMLPERYIPIIKFSSILKDSINEKNNNR